MARGANRPDSGKLIDEIAKDSPWTLIVVASIIPIANDGTNQKVQAYNAAIPGVVSKAVAAGEHVVFVDNYSSIRANRAMGRSGWPRRPTVCTPTTPATRSSGSLGTKRLAPSYPTVPKHDSRCCLCLRRRGHQPAAATGDDGE